MFGAIPVTFRLYASRELTSRGAFSLQGQAAAYVKTAPQRYQLPLLPRMNTETSPTTISPPITLPVNCVPVIASETMATTTTITAADLPHACLFVLVINNGFFQFMAAATFCFRHCNNAL